MERAVSEHRAALDAFLEFVGALEQPDWHRAHKEGKWTTALVTEHLSLAYDAAVRDIEEGVAMAPRLSRGVQTVLRWFLLPHMLYHRTMPRARSPREARPQAAAPTAQEGMTRLRESALRFERAFADGPDVRLTHPYFGRLDAVKVIRLAALHVEHHHRLLSVALTRTR